jgi:hypothetical protein
VSDLLNAQLQAQETVDVQAGTPFATVAQLLKVGTAKSHQLTDNDAKNNYNVATDKQLLFASRDGTKIGVYTDPIWRDPVTKVNSDRDKFFEIALIRNEALSPNDAAIDATAPLIAYTARVRWPSFVAVAGSTTTAIQVGANPTALVPFDHSQKQVLFVTGAINR